MTGGLEGRKNREIKIRGKEAGSRGVGRNRGGERTKRTRYGNRDGILSTKDMDNITGELGVVGKMALLSGRPWQRGTEKGGASGSYGWKKG